LSASGITPPATGAGGSHPWPDISAATITPSLAVDLLQRRRPGAVTDAGIVALYRQQMQAGQWRLSGMPIILSRDGVLLDGLHRLLACVEVSGGFPCFVARGVADAAGHTIDQHRRRTFTDILTFRGVPHAPFQAALLLRLIRYEGADLPSWERQLAMLQANPGIEVSLVASLALAGSPLPEPVRSAILHMGFAVDRPRTERLFRALAHPSTFGPGEPGRLLRRALEAMPGMLTTRAGQVRAFGLALRALDATLRGEELTRLEADATPQLASYPGLARPGPMQPVGEEAYHPVVTIERISPPMAEDLLTRSRNDGRVVKAHVAAIARDIAGGRWMLNAQPLCFAADGKLLDGQHRLLAAVAARASIETAVVRGLPESADITYDTQAKRAPEIGTAAGRFGDRALVAAMANMLWRQERRGPRSSGRKATAAEIRQILLDHPRLLALRGFARRMIEFGHASVIGYAALVIEREHPARGAAFLRALETGADLPAGHPVLALRSLMLRRRREGALPDEQLATLLGAWARWRDQPPQPPHRVPNIAARPIIAPPPLPSLQGLPQMSNSPSPDAETQLRRRTQQHTLVAAFGRFALGTPDIPALLQRAAEVAAEGHGTRFAKVLKHEQDTDMLLLCAGVGWREGLVGTVRLPPGASSPAGFAFATGTSTVSNELSTDHRFGVPAMLAEHGIVREVNVVIRGEGPAFGVLEVDDTAPGQFSEPDISFIESLANTLGLALERRREAEGREKLLVERGLLLSEVHHRVRNSLQLVHTVLTLQAGEAEDDAARQMLDISAMRVMTIAAVHERLYQGERFDVVEMRGYLLGLIEALHGSLAELAPGRSVALLAEPGAFWPPQRAQVLGMVLAELVTNALRYGSGEIRIRFGTAADGATLEVEDDGAGLPADFETGQGVGLGMRIVSELMRGQGGRLSVVKGGPGTRLRADFPQQPA